MQRRIHALITRAADIVEVTQLRVRCAQEQNVVAIVGAVDRQRGIAIGRWRPARAQFVGTRDDLLQAWVGLQTGRQPTRLGGIGAAQFDGGGRTAVLRDRAVERHRRREPMGQTQRRVGFGINEALAWAIAVVGGGKNVVHYHMIPAHCGGEMSGIVQRPGIGEEHAQCLRTAAHAGKERAVGRRICNDRTVGLHPAIAGELPITHMATIEGDASGKRMRAPLPAQIERKALCLLTHLGGVERAGVQRLGIGAGNIAIGIQCAAIGRVTGSAFFDELFIVFANIAIDGVAAPYARVCEGVQCGIFVETMIQLRGQ